MGSEIPLTFNSRPPVVWITGLSGAGKSTMAHAVVAELTPVWPGTILVDGDAVRDICGNDLGFTTNDRLANAYRIARLCKFLNEQNILVVCSTISFFHEIHEWNRKNLSPYLEVRLEVPVEELKRRDSKGLYNLQSKTEDVVGIDQILEEPKNPDLVLMNSTQDQFASNLESIVHSIYQYATTNRKR